MTLQPGQSLSAEDCKLLEAGDWLLVRSYADVFNPAQLIEVVGDDTLVVNEEGFGRNVWGAHRFTFLGRPGADGFIPWTGGENPAGEMRVEVQHRDGSSRVEQAHVMDLPASWWKHERSSLFDHALDIIAWRPAPSVEGLGDPDLQKMQISDGALPEAAPLSSGPTGNAIADALIAGFLHGVGREPWEDMHDYIAVCAMDYIKGQPLPKRPEVRPLRGYEGLYTISDHGMVYSIGSKKYLRGSANKKGYATIKLRDGAKRQTTYVHKLVAENFLEPVDGAFFVNHIDGDKSNNRAENLEWVTLAENNRHAIATGLRDWSSPTDRKGLRTPDAVIRSMLADQAAGFSTAEIAEMYRMRSCSVSRLLRSPRAAALSAPGSQKGAGE